MVRTVIINAYNWNPIIQMSDGVNNKFTRTDGKHFSNNSNIYYFQEEFYAMLSKHSSFVHEPKDSTNILKQIQESNDKYYFVNKSYKGDKIYKVLQVIDVVYNNVSKPVMMVEDIEGTPEELYISDFYERHFEDIPEIDL
jgi:hypothetical protein|nr:MAG TPA: hypothetical protein [Caudoviricetes sp.]